MRDRTKRAARVLATVASIGFLTGCATTSTALSGRSGTKKVQLPAPRRFWALRRERYVLGRNDCSNKAGRYARHLIEALGCEASVVVVKTTRGTHAVTKLDRDGETLYADPTSGAGVPIWRTGAVRCTRSPAAICTRIGNTSRDLSPRAPTGAPLNSPVCEERGAPPLGGGIG